MKMWTVMGRKRIVRTATIYAIASAGLWGACDIFVEALGLPPVVLTAVVVASLVGFPFVVGAAWFLKPELETAGQMDESDPDTGSFETMPQPVRHPYTTILVRFGVLALAVWGVFSVGWLMSTASVQRSTAETIDRVIALVDNREYESAFTLAVDHLPDDASLDEVWNGFSSRVLLIRSEPSGALVSRRPYDNPEAWQPLGTTPISDVRLPLGLSVVRFETDQGMSVDIAVGATAGDTIEAYLPDQSEIPPEMVWVPGGSVSIPNYAGTDADLPPYLIDRYEVTNRDFRDFLEAGGYQDRAYWQLPMKRGAEEVPWPDAIALFVDATGFPGPSTWEAGDYPDGADDLPVQGLSWFEANAYAVFREKELPTVFHWHRAAQVQSSSFSIPASNFGGERTSRIGEYHGLTGWGTYDMAGNVREWVTNASQSDRFILGGAWNDYPYLFSVPYAVDPWDRDPKNGLRLAKSLGLPDTSVARQPLDLPYRDYETELPVSEEMFEAFRSSYSYDPLPLNAEVLSTDTTEDWVVKRIAFDAAYDEERVLADLYIPNMGRAPFQAIIYMPGSGSLRGGSLDATRSDFRIDFIVKTGRAVLMPALKGTLDRRIAGLQSSRASETYAYAEFATQWVKDARRSVDFLESQPNIDPTGIGYFGISWGGRLGAMMLALEPRFKVGVLYLGGLHPERALPVADDLNFVPQVRQPVLMINGREDHLRPLEASQLPFYRLLGTPEADKEHLVFPGGHFVPRSDLIRETTRWFEKYLGPTE